jgi:hypothetical protein
MGVENGGKKIGKLENKIEKIVGFLSQNMIFLLFGVHKTLLKICIFIRLFTIS